jgi:hypothetical protein
MTHVLRFISICDPLADFPSYMYIHFRKLHKIKTINIVFIATAANTSKSRMTSLLVTCTRCVVVGWVISFYRVNQ